MRHCELKDHYYHAVSQLYAGLHAEELQHMGERVAYYQDSADRLAKATKLAKGMDDEEVSCRCRWAAQMLTCLLSMQSFLFDT